MNYIPKGIKLVTEAHTSEFYISVSELNLFTEHLIEKYNLLDVERAVDNHRHTGTRCSNIFETFYPRLLSQYSLCYLKGTEFVEKYFIDNDISYTTKGLNRAGIRNDKYIQLVDLRIASLYLGKFKLSDKTINEELNKVKETDYVVMYLKSGDIIAGNKPVGIKNQPLIKVLENKEVDEEARNEDRYEWEGDIVKVNLQPEDAMSYVRIGSMLRKDIYITVKALAAQKQQPMYVVLEELLLREGPHYLQNLVDKGLEEDK